MLLTLQPYTTAPDADPVVGTGELLAFWGHAVDAPLTGILFGTVPARSSDDVRMRVKNRSEDYTATTVSVTTEGSPGWQFLFSLDARVFTGVLNLGDLAPTAVSPLIWLRRVTPAAASPASYQVQMRVHAASWT